MQTPFVLFRSDFKFNEIEASQIEPKAFLNYPDCIGKFGSGALFLLYMILQPMLEIVQAKNL